MQALSIGNIKLCARSFSTTANKDLTHFAGKLLRRYSFVYKKLPNSAQTKYDRPVPVTTLLNFSILYQLQEAKRFTC